MSRLSNHSKPSAKWQNRPESRVVSSTPTDDRSRRLRRDPPSLAPVCAKAAVENNEYQCDGAKLLCKLKILKFDFEQPVGAEQHAQQNKSQQHRDAETRGNLIEQYAEHRNERDGNDGQLQICFPFLILYLYIILSFFGFGCKIKRKSMQKF